MKDMGRHFIDLPRRAVGGTSYKLSNTNDGHSGLTISENDIELQKNKQSRVAEAEVVILKTIIQRENHLKTLNDSMKTLQMKYKNDISIILDMIRSSSLEVVELIEVWRQEIGNRKALFMWNEVNYLLKMTSDLDFMDEHPVVRKELFPLTRNPFCIPYPLEQARHVDQPFNDEYMLRIRQAEKVIIKEEKRHGKYSRDPDNRIVPRVQALARRAIIELNLDNYRPIDQPAQTIAFAPHAARSDIGAFSQSVHHSDSYVDPIRSSKFLNESEVDIEPFRRGETKVGGILSLLNARGVDQTRERKPLIPRIASSVEFSQYRKHQHVKKKLDMISNLKKELEKLIDQQQSSLLPTPPLSPSQNQDHSDSRMLSSIAESSDLPSSRDRRRSVQPLANVTQQVSSPINEMMPRFPKRVVPQNDATSTVRESSSESFCEPETLSILSALDTYKQQLQKLKEDEFDYSHSVHHLESKFKVALKYKEQERKWINNEKSRAIERKRRLLNEMQGRRKIPLNDEPNAFDYYAIRIQSTIRGWLGRVYSKWYVVAANTSSTTIQRYCRGWICRHKIKQERRRQQSATIIQKCFRGRKARKTVALVTNSRDHWNSVIIIQKMVRGWLGKGRLNRKRDFDETSRNAFNHIDEHNLSVDDIKELGERIENALETKEGESVDLPPEEVLVCLRIVALIVKAVRGAVGYTSYDFINQRYFYDIDGNSMSWKEAGKLCVRSNRLLHILRSLTYGPTSKPPRLLYIPPSAMKLFYQLKKMPYWNLSSLEGIGKGSRCCCQLYQWLMLAVDVQYKQPEFLSFLTSTFPDWLNDLYKYHETRRKCEFDLFIRSHCDKALETEERIVQERLHEPNILSEDDNKREKMYIALIHRERKALKKSIDTIQAEYAQTSVAEEQLIQDQMIRERYCIIQYESKFIQAKRNYENILRQYKHDYHVADVANAFKASSIQRSLIEQRRSLDKQRMVLEELETQMKLLLIQIGKNEERRRNVVLIPPNLQEVLNQAAEAKSQYQMTQLQSNLFLKMEGVKNPRFLTERALPNYENIRRKEEEFKLLFNNLASKADQMRMEYDSMMRDRLDELISSDNLSKNQLMPSEEQLQEERIEDDEQARRERSRRLQFISSDVMAQAAELGTVNQDTSKVHLILVSRDIPRYLRDRIITELSKQSEVEFAYVDKPTACCGLDFQSIQMAIKSNKCTIVYVDAGLTQVTMITFVETLKLLIQALKPKPTISILRGDDANPGRSYLNPHAGIGWQDIKILRDGDIKMGLDCMARISKSLQSKSTIKYMRMLGDEILPPEHSVILVIEAFLCLLASYAPGELKLPYMLRPGSQWNGESWSSSQMYLREPLFILSKLNLVRRGCHDLGRTISILETMVMYCSHPCWPTIGSKERTRFSLLNNMCEYIEAWCTVNRKTCERGGIPRIVLDKAYHPSIECVATISDTCLTGDDVNTPNNWHDAVNKVMKCLLSDYVVTRSTRSLNNVLYISSVYRVQDRIFFELYNPKSSTCFLVKCSANQVPSMLSPNAKQLQLASLHSSINSGEPMIEIHPPKTGHELYTRLLSYLTLQSNDKQQSNAVCKRVYSLLTAVSHTMNGYQANIVAYEVSLGEMYFAANIPEFQGLELETYITLEDRLPLYQNADHDLERSVFASDDVSTILYQSIDRLTISPSRSILRTSHFLQSNQNISISHPGLFNPKPRLKVQMTQGIGRVIYKGIVILSSIKYVTVVKSCTMPGYTIEKHALSKLLKVTIYEPREGLSLEARISNSDCRILLRLHCDDNSCVVSRLLERISIVNDTIRFDKTIISRDFELHGVNYVLLIEAADEANTFQINIINRQLTKKKFTCQIELQDLVKLSKVDDHSNVDNNTVQSENDPDLKTESSRENEPQHLSQSNEEWCFDNTAIESTVSSIVSRLKLRSMNIDEGLYIDEPIILIFYPEHYATALIASSNHINRSCKTFSINNLCDQFRHRNRRQSKVICMSDAAVDLACRKNQVCRDSFIVTEKLNTDLHSYLVELESSFASDDAAKNMRDVLLHAVSQTCSHLIEQVCLSKRRNANSSYGKNKQLKQVSFGNFGASLTDNEADVRSSMDVQDTKDNLLESEIIGDKESLIYQGSNIRAVFRGGSARWHDNISLSVYETTCWTNLDGKGRRLRFQVSHIEVDSKYHEDEEDDASMHDEQVEVLYEGCIRNSRQLRQILGPFGKDLLHEQKRQEMVLFIAKYCMQIIKLSDESKENAYTIEFVSDRLYDAADIELVTSLDIKDTKEDNRRREQEISRLKGKKIHRLTRRINGLLLQLTVYDVDREILPQLIVQQQQIRDKNEKLYQNEYLIAVKPSENNTPGCGMTPTLQQQLSFIRTPKNNKNPLTETSLQTPAFRIIGYDPRRKRKAMCLVLPAAVVEIAGGQFSPLLQKLDLRIDLAITVCENLVAFFPRGADKEFELVLRWSRAPRITGMIIVKDKSSSVASAPSFSHGAAALGTQEAAIAAQQAAAEKILRRPYKLYQNNIIISNFECIVAIFAETANDLLPNQSPDPALHEYTKKTIIINVYVEVALASIELNVSEDEQIERMGKCALDIPEGPIRDAAMRRFCRCLQVRLEEDDFDSTKQVIRLQLLDARKDYLSEYLTIQPRFTDIEAVRPMGIPTPFMPLDTLGNFIYRRAMTMPLRKILYFSSDSERQRFQDEEHYRECIVSVYTKATSDYPERGLILKIYDTKSRRYSVFHIGPSALENLCKNVNKGDLIEKISSNRTSLEHQTLDELERDFQMTTEAGDATYEAKKLILQLVDIALADIGLQETPDLKYIAYLRSSPYGVMST